MVHYIILASAWKALKGIMSHIMEWQLARGRDSDFLIFLILKGII